MFRCLKLTSLGKWKQNIKPIKIMRRIKEHKNFSALVFSHVGRRYKMKRRRLVWLKKAGLASRNIVHFLKKVILRCIGLCFHYHHKMKVAAFVLLINNSCICVIFSGESPQHNVFELKRQIHSFSREISLFSTIFRSNIHAAFQRVVQSFAVLTETVERK